MAGSKFKKRNLNRFRKAYPFIREAPVNSYIGDNQLTLEVGEVTFTGADSATYSFNEAFASAPTVTAISVDSESNDEANVNIFVTSISTTNVTFESSQTFTGKVQFHAILVGE